jgi:hypothetical protein
MSRALAARALPGGHLGDSAPSGRFAGVPWGCVHEEQGWFLAFTAFQYHLKFSFSKGTSLKPVPPVGQFRDVRSLNERETDEVDEKQPGTWIRQAVSIPCWVIGSPRNGGSSLQLEESSGPHFFIRADEVFQSPQELGQLHP